MSSSSSSPWQQITFAAATIAGLVVVYNLRQTTSSPKPVKQPSTQRISVMEACKQTSQAASEATDPPGSPKRCGNTSFSEVEEVYVPGIGWQTAPPPKEPAGRSTDCFIAHHRNAPSGNVLETATWIELRDARLVLHLRQIFPLQPSLYDVKPGVRSDNELARVVIYSLTESHSWTAGMFI